MKYHAMPSFLLRAGLATVFLYAAIASLLEITSWIGFLPRPLSGPLVLKLFSFYEIALALWLYSGKQVLWAGTFSSLTLFAIIVANMGALDIVFRDVAIFFAALALVFLSLE